MSEANSTPPSQPSILESAKGVDKQVMFRWFFFGVFAFLLYQLLLILSLFADVIVWAASLTLVFWPIHQSVQRRLPGRLNSPAALTTSGVFLLVFLPILFIAWMVVVQSTQLYPTVLDWITVFRTEGIGKLVGIMPPFMQDYWQSINAYINQSSVLSQFDLEQFILSNINTISLMVANFGAVTAGAILLGFINIYLFLP
jgi:predicted PurR-regulated permease PerM